MTTNDDLRALIRDKNAAGAAYARGWLACHNRRRRTLDGQSTVPKAWAARLRDLETEYRISVAAVCAALADREGQAAENDTETGTNP